MQRSYSKNMKHKSLEELQQQLQLRFSHLAILEEAFTHSSFINERASRRNLVHNERLEFLGDAVLQITMSEFLYAKFPKLPEGRLSKMRAASVNEASLAEFAKQLELGSYIRLGRGDELLGGRERPSLLADLFEALLGAIYLEHGLDVARQFLQKHMFPHLNFDQQRMGKDYKTQLQERIQKQEQQGGLIEYRLLDTRGPAHDREFEIGVWVSDVQRGVGVGRTKKEAEQQAAAAALKHE